MPDTLTTHPLAAAPAAGGAAADTGPRTPRAGYRIAALVAAAALMAAIAFGGVGTLKTLDRADGFARTAIPGAPLIALGGLLAAAAIAAVAWRRRGGDQHV